jgi:hypothetical protein
VANTTTLIYGERDALLVDTFLSEAQTGELVDWIVAVASANAATASGRAKA